MDFIEVYGAIVLVGISNYVERAGKICAAD